MLTLPHISFLYPNSVSSDKRTMHVLSGTVMLMPEMLAKFLQFNKFKVTKRYAKPWHSAQHLFL